MHEIEIVKSINTTFHTYITAVSAWNTEGTHFSSIVLGCALIVGFLLPMTPLWKQTRIVITLFHELGHAFLGIIVGGRVTKIRLERTTAGVTHWEFAGNPGRIRQAIVGAAGYTVPPILAAGCLLAYTYGLSRIFGAILLVGVSLSLLLWVRNLWGILSTVCIVGVSYFLIIQMASGGAEVLLLFGFAFLWSGSVRGAFEHFQDEKGSGSDSEVVSSAVFIPRVIVQYFFLTVSILFPLLAGVHYFIQ